MKNITLIQPTQKYMTLHEIKKTYGSCWIVAYACKIKDATLYGGYVIAVQNQPDPDYSELKAFRNKFAKQYADKKPVYCFCLEDVEGSDRYSLTYDNGIKAVKRLPKIKIKKTEAEEAVESIPDTFLAAAIKASIQK